MPASKIPPPEKDAIRIYIRNEKNVSIPYGWLSKDRTLLLTDNGEILSNSRLSEWILHAYRVCKK